MHMKKKKRVMSGILIGVFTISGWWVGTGYVMGEAVHNRANGTYAYAIVLGAKVNGVVPSLSLQHRLESAFTYAQQHPHVSLVLSGGQGPDEGISEAQAMANYLAAKGMPQHRMILEDTSTSTYENLANAKQLLPASITGATLITNDYHMARAGMIAKKVGLDWDAVPAPTPPLSQAKAGLREPFALLKTYIVGR